MFGNLYSREINLNCLFYGVLFAVAVIACSKGPYSRQMFKCSSAVYSG